MDNDCSAKKIKYFDLPTVLIVKTKSIRYNANKVKEQLIKNELLKTMKIEIVLLLFLRLIRL